MKNHYATNNPLYRAEGKSQQLYLTFDDGPDPEWTPRILDILADSNVYGTFFVIGKNAIKQPVLIRRIIDEGHELGNHTWSHRHPFLQSARQARREVRDGALTLEDLCGRAVRWFRPPYGVLRKCMIDQASANGEAVALWSLSAIDWGLLAKSARISMRLSSAKAGDILLMHDGRGRFNHPDQTSSILPGLIEQFLKSGFALEKLTRRLP